MSFGIRWTTRPGVWLFGCAPNRLFFRGPAICPWTRLQGPGRGHFW